MGIHISVRLNVPFLPSLVILPQIFPSQLIVSLGYKPHSETEPKISAKPYDFVVVWLVCKHGQRLASTLLITWSRRHSYFAGSPVMILPLLCIKRLQWPACREIVSLQSFLISCSCQSSHLHSSSCRRASSLQRSGYFFFILPAGYGFFFMALSTYTLSLNIALAQHLSCRRNVDSAGDHECLMQILYSSSLCRFGSAYSLVCAPAAF